MIGSRHSGTCKFVARLTAAVVACLLSFGAAVQSVSAQIGAQGGQAPAQFAAQVEAVPQVPQAEAEKFGKLLVRTSAGRIEPINTYSSELLRKIYHSDHIGGMNSDQALLSLLSDPSSWSMMSLIYVKDKDLLKRFGAEGSHISYESLFDSDGSYILAGEMDEVFAKDPSERDKSDKELMKLDEKVSILYSLFTGRMMSLFPADEQGWLSSGDDLSMLSGKDSLFVAKGMEWYLTSIKDRKYSEAAQVRDMIVTYQSAKIPDGVITEGQVKAETFYNRADIFRRAFRLYLILGFTLLCVSFAGLNKGAGRSRLNRRLTLALTLLIAAVFLWQNVGMGLRWYISGRPPWTNSYESMVYIAWTMIISGLIFVRRAPMILGLATLMGGVILFVSNLSWLDPQITPLVPVLKSRCLIILVSVVTASYGFFGICAVAGLTSLVMLLGGRVHNDLRKVNEMAMIIGLVLLAAGIFLGAVWANESWGRYWGWDPKETWALITMIVYAFITHSRFIPGLNNYFAFSAMSVAGIGAVIMTFFGVNYLLSGLHSYGNSGGIAATPLIIALVIVVVLAVAAGLKYRRLRG